MRICHVVEAAGGGVGQVIIDLTRSGLAVGDDVTVVYALGRATPHFVDSLSPMLGPKFIPISMQREVGLHDVPDAWALYKTLRAAGPFDVIQGHSSKAGALVRITGLLFPKSVKIYSPHAFITLDMDASRIYGVFEKILSWLPGKIVALSQIEEEHARKELHISRRKLAVVPNGIELDHPATRASARATMKRGDDEFIVGFVGRFVPQKNPLRAVEAFARAAQKVPGLRLALVGNGILQERIGEAIAARHLTDRVDFFSGYAGRDLMPGFDCLLCSSDYEGFAIIFLEALAAGVPIITTPVGGAHETVLAGETGFIAPDFSDESLGETLAQFARLESAQRARMAENARQRARNFSLERVAGQMHALYAALLEKRRA